MTTDIIALFGGQAIRLTESFTPLGLNQAEGAAYEVYLLDPTQIDDFMALQVIGQQECIAAGTPHHIKPRGREDLAAHIAAGMDIIGIRHIATGAHVGQALLTNPDKPEALNMDAYPLRPDTRVVQSFYIHPSHRYSVLPPETRAVCHPAQLIFAAAEHLARQDGAAHLMAKISEDNNNSIRSFARHGFDQTLEISVDPVRGHLVRYVGMDIMPAMAVQPALQGDRIEASCHL